MRNTYLKKIQKTIEVNDLVQWLGTTVEISYIPKNKSGRLNAEAALKEASARFKPGEPYYELSRKTGNVLSKAGFTEQLVPIEKT